MPKIRAHPPLLMARVSQKGYGYGIREKNHHPISEPKMNRPVTTKSQGLQHVLPNAEPIRTNWADSEAA